MTDFMQRLIKHIKNEIPAQEDVLSWTAEIDQPLKFIRDKSGKSIGE